MYRKFKIEYSLARNMFSRSNTDFYMADMTSEGVNEYTYIIFDIEYSLGRNMFSRSYTDYCEAYLTSDGVSEYAYEVHDRGLICQKYVQ